MFSTTETQGTLVVAAYPTLRKWIDGFLVSKRAQNTSPLTLKFYQQKISNFVAYAERRNITTLEAIDSGLIREYLIWLEEEGHNPGGIHGYFRTLKVFLRWLEDELDDPTFKNPIRKIKAPKVPEEILEPVAIADVQRMVEACENDRLGLRDKAILLTLLDTGARATELTNFDLLDLNQVTGELIIRRGKGGKSRVVFAGQKTRKALRSYLKLRGDQSGALFLTRSNERLDYCGLRQILRRRASESGIDPIPSLHSFRRAFALAMLRAGTDLLTLQRLLGHADLTVLRRYVKQTDTDLRIAHAANSPVDRA